MRIARRWTADEKETYFVEGRSSTRGQVAGLVDCLGLVYTNPYNCVQQGKITQIANMDEHELYRLLEESTGVRKYYQKRQ